MAKIWTRIIAALEIAGGIFGVAFVLFTLGSYPLNRGIIFLAVVVTAVYVFSVVAGIMLWQQRPLGHISSIIVQLIQLPKLVSPLLAFMFSFGFDFYVYWMRTETFSTVGVDFKFLAFHQFFIADPDLPIGLGVSIPAMIFIAILVKTRSHSDSTDSPMIPEPEIFYQ